jgi:hypothetical protein
VDTAIIDKVREDLDADLAQIEALAQSDNFADQADTVTALQRSAETKRARLETLTRALQDREQLARIDSSLTKTVQTTQRLAEQRATSAESLGELFVRSRQFSDWSGYGQSGKVEVPAGHAALERRAVSLPIKTTDLPSFLIPGWQQLPLAQLVTPLLDLIPTITTSMTSFPVAGVKVSEGGAAVVDEGEAKPPLDIAEDKVDVALEMVAVYTQVTRQVLALGDSVFIRDAIDTELRRAVLKKLNELAVAALTGATLPTATVPSTSSLVGAIRAGIATVQTAGYTPTAVAVNPTDYAAADTWLLDKAGACCKDGYWGLQVVAVPGLTAGSAIVGDFAAGMRRYVHTSGLSLFATDSHADTFIHNVITLLCEQLSKTVVTRADAFAKVTVSAP